jgi:hypothetical protein
VVLKTSKGTPLKSISSGSSWQGFQDVVRTIWWEELEEDIKEEGQGSEIYLEIERISELLDED